MSKSILVIDTPECCDYCPVGRIFGMDGRVECVASKSIRVNSDGRRKPDWCPLRKLPEKKIRNEIIPDKEWGCGFASGYNYCIDDILEGD